MRCVRLLVPALASALLAGCGNSRTPVPSLTQPAAPAGLRPLVYPDAGIAFYAPSNWTATVERLPLVATISSGAATVAVWRYPRTGPVPSTRSELAHALRALIRGARARDPTLRVIRSRLAEVDGAPAVVLLASETIAGQRRRVRSVHVFRPAAELVIDEYAPPGVFGALDRRVFAPLTSSVRLFA